MTQEGHKIWNYIDDFLCVSLLSKINHSYSRLQSLLEELGLTVSTKKLVPPSTQVVCLGILVDTETFTVSIPTEKLQVIKQMCLHWSTKNFCTKKSFNPYLVHCFMLPNVLNMLASFEQNVKFT